MAIAEDDLALQLELRQVLLHARNPISYGALARDLNVPGPGAIGKVTAALERMMHDDYVSGRPFLASMCQSRLTDGMPAPGFFQTATLLGRYTGPATGPEAAAFARNERAQLGGR